MKRVGLGLVAMAIWFAAGPVLAGDCAARAAGASLRFAERLVGPGAATAAVGAPEWILAREATSPSLAGPNAAYDSVRRRVVLFNGNTWEWDGRAWVQRTPAKSPPGWGPSNPMAYDSARHRVVLFGGTDMWEWDGKTWIQVTPATSPPPRGYPAMVYDGTLGRVLLFGGCDFTSGFCHRLNDTWEWDGSNWTQRTPVTSPPGRAQLAMAYDGARGRVVLFGGGWGSYVRNDTWEWDGNDWIERAPATSPPGRVGHAMAYDSARGRVVLFGGYSPGGDASTWEWDGNTWFEKTDWAGPCPRSDHAMAYDSARERVVLFGGYGFCPDGRDEYDAGTWEWDGNTWAQKTPVTSPSPRISSAIAYDSARNRVVLFGGTSLEDRFARGDTWEWDGTDWVERTPAVNPAPRSNHAMTYDSARGRVVLFGGIHLWEGPIPDTWEWDGNDWIERTPATSPPAAYYASMAYDSARGRAVLFGAFDASDSAETWEWEGSNWTQETPPTSPPVSNSDSAMAYDSARGRVVLFGGYDSADTWEWDGIDWMKRTPATSPPARHYTALTYDSARGRAVLFGGYAAMDYTDLADTWEWDGNTWAETTPATRPATSRLGYFGPAAMAYDSARQRVVFFGGTTGMETWEYGPITGCSQSTSVKEFVPRGGTDATSAVAALGARDGHTVSLGLGGVLVVRMSPPIASGPGTDFIVYAKGAHDGGIDETYRVEASTDNVHWAFVRDCPGGECPLDLAATDLTYARWVRITDLSPQEEGSDFPTVGVDIDAVVATRCAEECSIALLAPVDGATFTWSGPSPTFTWSSTCEATYQVEFSNSREFEHPALFVLPAHPLHQTSFTPNHGNWTAIGNLAKNRGGTGTVYWRVGGYGSDDEVIRSPASSFKIDWRPRH